MVIVCRSCWFLVSSIPNGAAQAQEGLWQRCWGEHHQATDWVRQEGGAEKHGKHTGFKTLQNYFKQTYYSGLICFKQKMRISKWVFHKLLYIYSLQLNWKNVDGKIRQDLQKRSPLADSKYVQVKLACRDVVKERGLDKITVEDLVQVLISWKLGDGLDQLKTWLLSWSAESFFLEDHRQPVLRRLPLKAAIWCQMRQRRSFSGRSKPSWSNKPRTKIFSDISIGNY